ncbi:MAG: TIGR03767 family metallophosphoesterase [Candidatus Dormiibacterota bacterium]|jgi:metallophosphoesterase (TIGR03767 family)
MTTKQVVVLGAPGRGGYRQLEVGTGEPVRLRTDLGGSVPSPRLRSLLAFVQLSDLHVTDVQSPTRAEFLDRSVDEEGTQVRAGTYRPQQALSCQVVEAAARTVRALSGGPAAGAPLAFAISTGDAADNGQRNELVAYLALLDGGREVVPDSGDPERYEGVDVSDPYDTGYWHPDGTPPGQPDDLARARRGFPEVAGLHQACRKPFVATGLGLPWYAVYGNHDALLAGAVPPVAALVSRAVSGDKLSLLDLETDVVDLLIATETEPQIDFWLRAGCRTRPVTSDPARRPVQAQEWIAAHRELPGEPCGHGFDAEAAASGRAYYRIDSGMVSCLILDTVNRAGGWQGSLDADQFRCLESELVAGHGHYYDASGEDVWASASDRLFILASHHPLECFVNAYPPDGPPRVLRDEVQLMLARFPNVVLWVNGHTHMHTIVPFPAGHGKGRATGFWQVTTSSLIDWPQQARSIELAVDETTGDLVITAVAVDHSGRVNPAGQSLDDIDVLAGWSRELAANAWQRRRIPSEPDGQGTADDRNVALVVPAPFPLTGARRLESGSS